MAIPSGTRLGPYEVLAPIGAGGMGEVYRARDSRIGRDVAIKILPAKLAQDPERLRRSEQEARAAGLLNHPNILIVHDVGTYDGSPYLVTELLEGETLRNRLRSGRVPSRKAVEYASQLARGLGAAHEKGIIHRDLKPENIFLCRDGRVKILDFGLAKLTQQPADDRTVTMEDHTNPGAVLGTAGYMSPEQVRGLAVDQRSDIFSFGAVLYEMLSGQRAFHGDTPADTISAILNNDPPELQSPDRGVSPALEQIVRHCLEKNPEERFQSARDLAFNLESSSNISDTGTAARRAAPAAPTIPRRFLWPTLALVLLILVLAGLWLASFRRTAPRQVQFQRLTDFEGLEEAPAVSPDGKSVAFVADSTGTRQLWVRLLAGGAPLQITRDSGNHLHPRWSQDSASIIYFVPPKEGEEQGVIWEVPSLGGSPRRLSPALSGADASHNGKNLAFFRLNNQQVELVVTDRDGRNERLVGRFGGTYSYRQPRWSPDDSLIAYVHSRENWTDDIYMVKGSGGPERQLTQDRTLMTGFSWLPNGSGIVYSSARGSTLFYLPTSHLWTAPLSGEEPRQLTFGEVSDENPDVDRDGRIVVSHKRMQFNIWRFPVDGDPLENVRRGVAITNQTGQVQTPSTDPTDRELVYLSDTGGHGNLWVRRLETGETRQITFEKDPAVTMGVPVWSPDGNWITFAVTRPAGQGRDVSYSLIHPDGSALRVAVPQGAWATWSGDSRWIYYSESSPLRETSSFRLMKQPIDGGTAAVVRTDNARGPALAPDGSALYYVVPLQNLYGLLDYELRVARPEDGPSTLLARISGVRVPLWQGLHPVISRDGKWLVTPLNDELGTNIYAFSTEDGKVKRITDFGSKRTFIARRVSWSSDGHYVYAAVGEGDADIVLLDGLLP
jgi:eukaryotic-like serine/threonine-protein kinase